MRKMIKHVFIGSLLMGCVSMVVGCGCQEEINQIKAMQNQVDQLKSQNNDYRGQVAELQKYNDELRRDNNGKKSQLAQASAQNSKLQTLNDELRTKLAEAPKARPVAGGKGWEIGLSGDKISVGSDVLFSSGRATLTRAGKATLSRIAREIKGNYAGLPVRVYGYTDSDPIRKSRKLWQDNLDLSANRAMAVTRYLISVGVAKDRIETIGMGDTRFQASNRTSSGKAKNRRVEIIVVKSR